MDFAGIQYRTLSGPAMNVQGQTGNGMIPSIRYVREDLLPEMEYLKPYLDAKYKELETGGAAGDPCQWNPVFAMDQRAGRVRYCHHDV